MEVESLKEAIVTSEKEDQRLILLAIRIRMKGLIEEKVKKLDGLLSRIEEDLAESGNCPHRSFKNVSSFMDYKEGTKRLQCKKCGQILKVPFNPKEEFDV